MKVLIQRVTQAQVSVEDIVVGKIDNGICLFLGIHNDDKPSDIKYIISKLLKFRLFEDDDSKFVYNIKDVKGDILVISQFTLYGNLKKGTRASFTNAMNPKDAEILYDQFCKELAATSVKVETGQFGKYMEVSLTNSGPATFTLESARLREPQAAIKST